MLHSESGWRIAWRRRKARQPLASIHPPAGARAHVSQVDIELPEEYKANLRNELQVRYLESLGAAPSDADFQKAALKLEAIGFAVGHRLVERYTRDRPRFSDTLEIIKFICKDFWCAPRNFAAQFRAVL